jgi:hypothetical protein
VRGDRKSVQQDNSPFVSVAHDVEFEEALCVLEQNQKVVLETALQSYYRVHIHSGSKEVLGVARHNILAI